MNVDASGRYATVFITLITVAGWAFITHALAQALATPGIV